MLIEPQFRTKFGDTIWGIAERIARMAAFEGALASAQAVAGLIPKTSAKAIVRACKTALPEANDIYEKARKFPIRCFTFGDSLVHHYLSSNYQSE